MKLNKVTYNDLKILMKYVSEISRYIQEASLTTNNDSEKMRLVADYDLAAALAKMLATKMINMNGKKHCTITLKSYEAIFFIDYQFICQRYYAGFEIVVFEKHIQHIYKELFTRNINHHNERKH